MTATQNSLYEELRRAFAELDGFTPTMLARMGEDPNDADRFATYRRWRKCAKEAITVLAAWVEENAPATAGPLRDVGWGMLGSESHAGPSAEAHEARMLDAHAEALYDRFTTNRIAEWDDIDEDARDVWREHARSIDLQRRDSLADLRS